MGQLFVRDVLFTSLHLTSPHFPPATFLFSLPFYSPHSPLSVDLPTASDMRIKARAERVEAVLAKQSSWVNLQNLDMRNINERFEHLVNVLTVEMKSEHEREYRLLSAQKIMTRTEATKIWEERFSSVDRIMATVQAYGLTKVFPQSVYQRLPLHR